MSDPLRKGPLFYWRGQWRGEGSEEVERGERQPPPQNLIEMDAHEYAVAEWLSKKGRRKS